MIVDYDEAKYPGEVISVDEDFQYEVNVMHPSGNHWKWPKTEDKIFYSLENIVKLISPPKAAGHPQNFFFFQTHTSVKDFLYFRHILYLHKKKY